MMLISWLISQVTHPACLRGSNGRFASGSNCPGLVFLEVVMLQEKWSFASADVTKEAIGKHG